MKTYLDRKPILHIEGHLFSLWVNETKKGELSGIASLQYHFRINGFAVNLFDSTTYIGMCAVLDVRMKDIAEQVFALGLKNDNPRL